jgi:hypothetical protein
MSRHIERLLEMRRIAAEAHTAIELVKGMRAQGKLQLHDEMPDFYDKAIDAYDAAFDPTVMVVLLDELLLELHENLTSVRVQR